MLEEIKKRCGIASGIKTYDGEIKDYIDDCKDDMVSSGVLQEVVESQKKGVLTAITLYVKAHIGDDRSDTEKYLDLYRKKVFRLTLEDAPEVEDVE